ncbi:zinc-ribbon domain-containing protein [Geomonas sp. Red32]|uniref:zinc-ribbon domain-containing protein n=1 Tax=Geomonas sp. Red32 TaxID=2912856 RepID=UPI00202CD83D|nr:zinc-ribbon domain-containing protein [Geomonas sp. Red32]MCM0081123.1 zinc-ribbon domain-containing protein [Geomonas sp. Red32]
MEEMVVVRCPLCDYKRSVKPDSIPKASASVHCPQCGAHFPLSSPTGDTPSVPRPPQPGTASVLPGEASSRRRLKHRLFLPLALYVAFYVFAGRLYVWQLPKAAVPVVKNWTFTGERIAGEPAAGLPVVVKVGFRKRERFYWGDGSNGGETTKTLTFYTYTDRSGMLRLPRTPHFLFLRATLFDFFDTDTTCYLPQGARGLPQENRDLPQWPGINFASSPIPIAAWGETAFRGATPLTSADFRKHQVEVLADIQSKGVSKYWDWSALAAKATAVFFVAGLGLMYATGYVPGGRYKVSPWDPALREVMSASRIKLLYLATFFVVASIGCGLATYLIEMQRIQ